MSTSAELHALSTTAQALASLQRQFVNVAPSYLAQCSQVVGFRHGLLVIAASNASAAAKLRQLAPELTAMLNSKGCEVSEIRIKVQVDYARPRARQQPRLLGAGAQNALQLLGQSLHDSPLKHAVERLARRKG